ncbi:MAG: M48 family metalloprotease [Chlamydiia bacterium]|nr:M48 family metalloprotease [Chlamydiia bacterium]
MEISNTILQSSNNKVDEYADRKAQWARAKEAAKGILGSSALLISYGFLTPSQSVISGFSRLYFKYLGECMGSLRRCSPQNTYSHVMGMMFQAPSTKSLQRDLRKAGEALGVKGSIEFQELQGPDCITSVNSHAFSPEHLVGIHGIILRDPRELHLFGSDDRIRAPKNYLAESSACGRFFGIQALAHISLNTVLFKEAAHIATLIIGVFLMDSLGLFAEPGMVNTLLQGLTVRLCQYITEGLVDRYQTLQADQKTVSYTKDRKAAVEALYCLKQLRKDMNLGSMPQGFLSIEERIEALDPNHEIDPPDFSSYEHPSKGKVPTEEQMLKDPEIQELHEVIAHSEIARDLAPAFLKTVSRVLISGSPLWMTPLMINAAQSLYPTSLPRFLNPYSDLTPAATSEIQERAISISREMGSSAPPPEVLVGGSPATLGAPLLTGKSVLVVPEGFTGESPQEDFTLRHEMAHLKNQDSLTKLFTACVGAILVHAFYPSVVEDEGGFSDIILKGLLVVTLQFGLLLITSRFLESRADRVAVQTSPSPQKTAQGGIAYFQGLKGQQQEVRKQSEKGSRATQIKGQLLISPTGENRLDWEHPPLQSRIEELKKLTH